MSKSYVYTITNRITNEIYVGKSDNPDKRWIAHKKKIVERLRFPFYRAMNEYGVENFEFAVIRECESSDAALVEENKTIVSFREQGIKLYNLNDGGFGGENPTEETRKYISKRVKEGLKSADLSFYKDPEYRQKLSESVKKSWNDNAISEKHSDGNRRAWADPEIRARMIEAMNTPESRFRRSIAHQGKRGPCAKSNLPEELKQQIRSLRASGKTLGEIISIVNVSGYQVRRVLTNNFTQNHS